MNTYTTVCLGAVIEVLNTPVFVDDLFVPGTMLGVLDT